MTDINGNTPFHILLQSSTNLITTDNKSVPDLETDIHYSIVILKLLLDYCKVSKLPLILNKVISNSNRKEQILQNTKTRQ